MRRAQLMMAARYPTRRTPRSMSGILPGPISGKPWSALPPACHRMENDPDLADPAYSHKPSLMGAAWDFRLRDDALDWRVAFREGRIPYRGIRRVRLSFRPVTMQSRRFITEIWSADGP